MQAKTEAKLKKIMMVTGSVDIKFLDAMTVNGHNIHTLTTEYLFYFTLKLTYQLEEVPSELGELVTLTGLVLCDNRITHLPKQLTHLTNLRSLFLHDNQLQTLPQNLINLTHLEELSLRNNPLVIRFIKEWPDTVPTLLELAGNTVKKKQIPYDSNALPGSLVRYLDDAQRCDNPKCKGVYFTPLFRAVKFVDFCGKYRVPLLRYLCSPMCIHKESCRYGHDCCSSSSSEEDNCMAAQKVKKVLLG